MNQLITHDSLTAELDTRGIRYSQLSLEIPESTTFEEWAVLGKKICRTCHVMNWWVADWAAFGSVKWPGREDNGKSEHGNGEKHYGALKRFASANGWAAQTIYHAATTARRVEPCRRRQDLSFSHHCEVASLSPKKQTEWLTAAERESIPIGKLRSLIRRDQGKRDANKPDGVVINWPQNRNVEGLMEWLKARPKDFWTPEMRGWWKEFLRPLVEFAEGL